MFTWFALMIVVRWMITLLTTRGPPHPPHQGTPMNAGAPHHGRQGSPQPSATQLTTGAPKPTDTDTPPPPKKATSAGAYTGATTTGPGAHPQTPPTNTQRP